MSSNPLKIKIKFSKGTAAKTDKKALDGTDPTSKKRKKLSEQLKTGVTRVLPEGVQDLNRRDSEAERDSYAEAKRPRADQGLDERQREGNDHPEPKLEQNIKPRLVIKGSFRSKEIQGRITPAKQSHDSLALASAEDLLPQKNKKKKKKRPVGRQVSAELKGKDTVKVEHQALEFLRQAPAQQKSVLPSERPSKIKAEKIPVKPSQLPAVLRDSQAPSTATALSEDGHAVSSRPSTRAGPGGTEPVPSQGTGQQENGSEVASKPDQLPGPGDVERLLNRLQRKDPHQIFKEPVTDAVAPGYSTVIKRPMSFAQMREKLTDGAYPTWTAVQTDLETMFNNAMIFNGPATQYHQKAREMMGIAKKLLHLVRTTGQLDARGRKANNAAKTGPASEAIPVAALAEKRTERRAAGPKPERVVKPKVDKKKVAARKAAQRAAASGVLARPNYEDGRGDLGPLSNEENLRSTFWPLLGSAFEQQWKGLGKGLSASGVAFGCGRPSLRANFSGPLSLEAYTASLKDFGSRLTGAAKILLHASLDEASKVSPAPAPAPVPAPVRPPVILPQQTWLPSDSTASPAPPWNFLSRSKDFPVPVGDPLQQNGQKLSLPTVATHASLYAGMQALSAANPPTVGSSQHLRPAAMPNVSMSGKPRSRPNSATGLASIDSPDTVSQQGRAQTLHSFQPSQRHLQQGHSQGQPQRQVQQTASANAMALQHGAALLWQANSQGTQDGRIANPLPGSMHSVARPMEWDPVSASGQRQ